MILLGFLVPYQLESIYQRKYRPIIKLRDLTNLVSKGELSTKIDINSKNEIGELANHFNKMVKNIAGLIVNIKNTTGILVEHSIALRDSSELSVVSSENVKLAVEQISMGTYEQVKEVEKTSNNTSELGKQIDNVVEKSVEIETITQTTKDISLNSREMMESLIKKSEQTNNVIKQILQEMSTLHNDIMEIRGITDLITTITKKISLLSLNAAITAGQTSSNSSGDISLIAREMSKLARQSRDSTVKIQPILNKIKEQADISKDISIKANKIVEEQMKTVYSTHESIDTVINCMDNIVEKITDSDGSMDLVDKLKEAINLF